MLSRATLPLLVLICILVVAGVSIFVQATYHQDQVAADQALQQGALTLMAGLVDQPLPADSPLTAADLPPLLERLRSEQHLPFDARGPLRWFDYEWRWCADRNLLIGRPKFYGRGFWLTVAVQWDATARQMQFLVCDAGGRWGVDGATLTLGPDWYALRR